MSNKKDIKTIEDIFKPRPNIKTNWEDYIGLEIMNFLYKKGFIQYKDNEFCKIYSRSHLIRLTIESHHNNKITIRKGYRKYYFKIEDVYYIVKEDVFEMQNYTITDIVNTTVIEKTRYDGFVPDIEFLEQVLSNLEPAKAPIKTLYGKTLDSYD